MTLRAAGDNKDGLDASVGTEHGSPFAMWGCHRAYMELV